jgi:type IX secretion system PorP/SprF family membrane protein
MKKILIVKFLLIIVSISFSQQIPQYSQYLRNHFFINPAAAGSYDFVDINLYGRSQWTGFDNSPKSSFASLTTSLKQRKKGYYNSSVTNFSEVGMGKMKHAIGAQIQLDEYGAFQNMNCSGTYALHIPITNKLNISFGTKIGFSNYNFLSSRAETIEPTSDNTYLEFTRINSNKYIVNLGAGLYLYSKRFFFGISADQLTKDLVSFGLSTINIDAKIYYNIVGGIKIKATKDIVITPALLVKYMSPHLLSIESSIQVEYNKRFWAGISYRNKDAIIGMFGMNVNSKMKFGYSFDYAVSRFNKYSYGSHELVLGIMF